MPGKRLQDASSEGVDRQALRQGQAPTFYADGDDYPIHLVQNADPNTYRSQVNLNDSWAFGVMPTGDAQVSAAGTHGNTNAGNALFWRDLLLGLDRMYLDDNGQLRVQTATPLTTVANDSLLLQATSDAGATGNGFGVGMIFQAAASNGTLPNTATIHAIADDTTAGTYTSSLSFSTRNLAVGVESLRLGGGFAKWVGSHTGNLVSYKLGFGHVAIGDGNFSLSTFQSQFPNLEFTGAITATRDMVLPALERDSFYIVTNSTTGGHSITFGASSGAKVTVGSLKTCIVFCDGTDYRRITPDT